MHTLDCPDCWPDPPCETHRRLAADAVRLLEGVQVDP